MANYHSFLKIVVPMLGRRMLFLGVLVFWPTAAFWFVHHG